jgi:molybdate transport system substrate-binding protein
MRGDPRKPRNLIMEQGTGRTMHGVSTRRALLGFAGSAALAAGAPSPVAAQARDLVVYAEPTLKPVMRQLGRLWRTTTGVRVNIFLARTELHLAQIERGTRCDVLVGLAGEAIDDAKTDKLINPATSRPVFRNTLVLVARDGTADGAADLATALTGRKLAIADPERDRGASYGLAALDKAGVTVDPESASVAVAESSTGVLRMLLDNKASIGLVYATDAAQRPTFKTVLVLGASSHPAIEYVAAEAVNAQSDTRPFLQFLKSNQARGVFVPAGLQPIGD